MITIDAFRYKAVAVFGLGKAGAAAAKALVKSNAKVYAWDDNEEGIKKLKAEEFAAAITFSDPKEYDWKNIAALVLSPGVPFTHPEPHRIVKMAKAANVPIICDVELLYQACPDARYVGITGTNGKSTTTALIGHMFNASGHKAEVGGNIGIAASDLPMQEDGTYVVELSSYQLDLLEKFHARVAVLLNLTPDHLDRHGDMEGYLKAKLHIFERQTKNDYAIIAVDDNYTKRVYNAMKKTGQQKVIAVSNTHALEEGVYIEGNIAHIRIGRKYERFALGELPSLKGKHNWQNIAAAIAVLYVCGVSVKAIEAGIKSFKGLAHRMQMVAEIEGVQFINDSKATNAEAAEKAMNVYDRILWIAGGKPKEGGIDALAPLFPKIKHAYLIGEAAEAFAKTLKAGKVPFTQCGVLDVAVKQAAKEAFSTLANKKPVVLLSPACASFDQFRSFEERGEKFVKLVKDLQKDAQ